MIKINKNKINNYDSYQTKRQPVNDAICDHIIKKNTLMIIILTIYQIPEHCAEQLQVL